MIITILTIVPQMLESLEQYPLIQRLIQKKELTLNIVDLRDYASGSFRHIDDSPYGGGPGMILRPEPVFSALDQHRSARSTVILFTPAGTPLNQAKVRELSEKEELILICGHYEGIDERITETADEWISVGDYILSGGESAAAVLVDAVTRLQENVIRAESTAEESFESGLLEYPQYTHPRVFRDREVPEVLLSGNHEKIRLWRLKESLRRTLHFRPDLLAQKELTAEESALLEEIRNEGKG
ncbi:MAG: tRNA (guanosine(37)-N1)-methyltransferase TrmD [Solobacterium sp.]|nr:tRNA (guanosine(37)-N1)-methyltransferase TrmD [Solobacterium sp.]